MTAKFNIGDKVTVRHHSRGTWTGKIKSRALSDYEIDHNGIRHDIWEYEVVGAPSLIAGQWLPLAWEDELELVK